MTESICGKKIWKSETNRIIIIQGAVSAEDTPPEFCVSGKKDEYGYDIQTAETPRKRRIEKNGAGDQNG